MKRIQRGFSIITAIFLLVVLAFLGVAMVTFSTSQHQSSAMDVMGSRAYQAARAGVEWAAFQVVTGAGCPASTVLPALGGTLQPFTVTITCGASAVAGDSITNVFVVNSTARTDGNPGDAGYIERVISTKMGR